MNSRQYEFDTLKDILSDQIHDLLESPHKVLESLRQINSIIVRNDPDNSLTVWGVEQFADIINQIEDPNSEIASIEENTKNANIAEAKMIIRRA